LGAGEAEALAIAMDTKDAVVVATDDRAAIRACKVLRISFVTSLGILTRAVEKGLLTKGQGLHHLESLRSWGRFSEELVEEVQRQIGGFARGESS
jgi:predicted nucleic acid-binding protein